MAVLSSEVSITGRDNGVAAMFDSIAAKIDKTAKAAKVSAPFKSMIEGLTTAEAQAKALAKVDTSKALTQVMRERALATKTALEQQRQLVAAEQAPTKAMLRGLEQREAAHAKTMAMYRREQTAFSEAKRDALGQGLSLERRADQQAMLEHVIERTTNAMQRQVVVEQRAAAQGAALERAALQRREFIERRGVKHLAVQTAGNVFAAHSVVTGLEHAGIEGANLVHAQNVNLTAGIPKLEVQGMTEQALDLSRRYKNVSQESLIELAKETRSAVVHPDEVPQLMPTLAAAKSVLDGLDRTGEAGGGLGQLVKGSEAIGAAQDPERLKRLIDGFVKANQVMGKTITPGEIYDFAKNSRLSGAQFSDRFLMTTAMSSIQELGGQTAGKAANEAVGQLSGAGLGKRTAAVKLAAQLGLIDEKDIVYNKTGEASRVRKGVLHPVKDDKLLGTDPDLFTYNRLLPAMEAHGITKVEDQLAAVRTLYSGSKSAQDLIGKFITQRESYEAHAKLYEQASGLKGADQMATDPLVAWQGFTTQLSNLAANLAEGPAKAAGTALDAIATGLGNLSGTIAKFNKDNPTLAPIVEGAGGAGAAVAGGVASWYALRGTLGLFGRMAGLGGGEAAGGAAAEVAGIAGAAGGEAGVAAGSIAAAPLVLPAIAGLGAGALLVYGADTKKGIVHGGRPDDGVTMSEMLPGIHDEEAPPRPAPKPLLTKPSYPFPAGQDFTLGRYDHVFSPDLQDDTPPGTFRPVSARRANKIAESYPASPQFPAAVAPLPAPAPAPPQVVDVTGKVQSDVNVTTGGVIRVDVQASPELVAKVGFQGVTTNAVAKPSTGASMPNAGLPAHPGRLGPN